ncbi:hypothetical protein DVH05_002277 [Phytophthora capsici]|nr:hypothetical protein DVH05_002277 [Phytophthora capsici]
MTSLGSHYDISSYCILKMVALTILPLKPQASPQVLERLLYVRQPPVTKPTTTNLLQTIAGHVTAAAAAREALPPLNMVELTKKEIAMFWNEGCVATSITISSELCNEVLKETQHLDFKPIFRKVYSKKLDRFRLQASIPVSGAALGEIHEIVASTVGKANPNWAIKESSWNALKSLPGGKNQSVHSDFPMFETARALLKHKLVQGSVIVALMDNTRLHVYPRCFGGHADKGKRKKVNLKQGTVLFFRGDLAHAGAKYDGLNIRLHFYVQIAGLSQEQNATEAVVFQTFRCDKCLKIAYTRKELAAHRRTCSERGLLKCPY